MSRTSFRERDCPIAHGAELIGDKWKLLIVRNAFLGIKRFDDFQTNLRISSKVLSARLAEMVEDGILAKEDIKSDRRVKLYSLTEKGEDLLAFTVSLAQWSQRWKNEKSISIVTKNGRAPVAEVTLSSSEGAELRYGDIFITHGSRESADLLEIKRLLANRARRSSSLI